MREEYKAQEVRRGDSRRHRASATSIRTMSRPATSTSFWPTRYLAKGDKTAAIAELERYAKVGGRSPETLKQLATLLEEAGDQKEAAAALDRLNYIYPVDEELHQQAGRSVARPGQHRRARFASIRPCWPSRRPIRPRRTSTWRRRTARPTGRTTPGTSCCWRSKPRPVSGRRRKCCWSYPERTEPSMSTIVTPQLEPDVLKQPH